MMSLVEIACEFRATLNGIQLSLIIQSLLLVTVKDKVAYPKPSKAGIKAKEVYDHSLAHDFTTIFFEFILGDPSLIQSHIKVIV